MLNNSQGPQNFMVNQGQNPVGMCGLKFLERLFIL